MRGSAGHRCVPTLRMFIIPSSGAGSSTSVRSLGDMACHTTDGIYAIMAPGYAATAEPIFMTAPVKDQFPAGMTIKMTFRPKADRPGFTTYWYEGKLTDGKDNMPATPDELKSDGRRLPPPAT